MSKTWKIITIVAIVAVAIGIAGVVGVAYAQTAARQASFAGGYGVRRGAAMGTRLAGNDGAYGPLHDDMIAALAQGLGMSTEDLQARLAKGETVASIAQEKGLTLDQFRTLWQEARQKAINAAVAAGTITQQQADRMLQQTGRIGPNGNCPTWGRNGALRMGPGDRRWGGQAPAQP